MYVDKAKTYIGVVEENKDPQRVGRCKVRVLDIFDDIPTEDIPWASPWKDLNGNSFNLPDIGKIVTVIFDSGNIYKPEYIYAEHFNDNLEEKLKSLSEKGYSSMKALMFDDKTQIFSNDDDGLMMDYQYNNINITGSKINLNLKDNFCKVHLGDAKAEQSAILGTSFLEWFDQFLATLVGGTAYHGNLSAPVIASPALVQVCKKYFLLKESQFLSKNVFLCSNFKVSSVINKIGRRPARSVQGDSYQSTAAFSSYTQTQTDSPAAPVDIRPTTSTETRPSQNTTRLDPQGGQDIPNYGRLIVSSVKTSPTLICYGGVDKSTTVGTRESGDYMFDYFGSLKNKFQVFVAKNNKIDAEESFNSVIKYLSDNGYNTSEIILYLFGEGYEAGLILLTKFKDKFKKIILVDIWLGNDSVSGFYVNFAKNNKDKVSYIYTNFFANNKKGIQELSQNSGYQKIKDGNSKQDHLDCNKLAIDVLLPEEIKTITSPGDLSTPPGFQTGGSTIQAPETPVSGDGVVILPTIGGVQNSAILSKQGFANGYKTPIRDFNGLTATQIITNMNSFITDVLEPFAIFLKSKYPELYKSWYITSTTRGYIPKGGSTTSQHLRGEAIDSQILGATTKNPQKNIDLLNAMLEWYKNNPVGYGQILFETNGSSCWVHWSYSRSGNKIQLLRFAEHNTKNAPANTTGKYVVGPLTASDLGFA